MLTRALHAAAAALVTTGLIAPALLAQVEIKGAGATFPGPLYAEWTAAYNKMDRGARVEYSATGSGNGIKSITDRVVHFGASDALLTEEQEKAAPGKLLHIPTVAGPVALMYNLPDLGGELVLDGPTIADIYMGKIRTWDDERIKKLNPSLKLPNRPVLTVRRSDGSGTTFIFTDYLSKVSEEFKSTVGTGILVKWPAGTGLAQKGSQGVANSVNSATGTIGYVELAFAKSLNAPYATVINKEGNPIKPTAESVTAATAAAVGDELPADLKLSITNASGADSYPIGGFTYLLVYDDLSYLENPTLAQELIEFLEWAVTDAQNLALEKGYAPLPENIREKVKNKIDSIKTGAPAAASAQ